MENPDVPVARQACKVCPNAASVGAAKPGRCAIMKPSRLVTEAACPATRMLSGAVKYNVVGDLSDFQAS
jgi:hypothetical protein